MSPFFLALSLSFIWSLAVGITIGHTVAMGGKILNRSVKLTTFTLGALFSLIPLGILQEYTNQILIISLAGYLIGLIIDLIIHTHHDVHLA